MNGDVLTNFNFSKFIKYHKKQQGIATIATYERKVKIDLGVIESMNEKIVGFKEKPEYNYRVSMGIYIFNKNILKYIPENKPFGFDNLMYTLIEHKEPVYSYLHKGYWLDLGNHEDYEKAQEEFVLKRKEFLRKEKQ